MKKNKLLFITSRPPYPLHAGEHIRAYSMLCILNEKYKVDLLTLSEKDINLSPLNHLTNQIHVFKLSKISSLINVMKGIIFNSLPFQINYFYSNKVQQWIDQNITNYDIVFCNNVRTAEYVKNKNIQKILDYVDSLGMNYEKAHHNSHGLWKYIYKVEKNQIANYERNLLPFFIKTIIISEIDKNYILQENHNRNIDVIQNFVKEINYDNSICPTLFKIGYLGKMNYEPNIIAVLFFCNKIFPELKKQFCDCSFFIIGTSPTKKIKNLMKYSEDIHVTGFMENPYNELYSCNIVVAPMISGAGIQNKILEAMSMGKCVVTTIIGVEGLVNLKGNELVICSSEQEMILKISQLFTNQSLIDNIGKNAKKYITDNYSYDNISKILLNILHDI
jgi:glycosyltransferase involved in cell wall biosynthesis